MIDRVTSLYTVVPEPLSREDRKLIYKACIALASPLQFDYGWIAEGITGTERIWLERRRDATDRLRRVVAGIDPYRNRLREAYEDIEFINMDYEYWLREKYFDSVLKKT